MPPARRKAPLSRTQILAGFIDKTLLPDLRARATEPVVADTLRARWDFERAHKRTAAALPEWTDQTLTQVAVAWVLSCVFVRVLEDRDLVPHARLAGRDARDSETLFYEQFSRLGARDYVLTVFTELSRSPVTEHLLGPALNPAWTLGPSHDAVRALLTLLRESSADGALSLRFDDPDTRFLGDLYQDLSADVRERFALLQTPDFVEIFILDHTLEPAITTFSLAHVRVIDPTCGSGHFLLGALRRIFHHLRAQRPDDDPRALVGEALAKVYGSDINPYAVAVARFRLLLEVISLGGYARLADAPALPALTRNVVVADSLLLGAKGTRDLAELALDVSSQSEWGPRAFGFQDPPAVNAVFRQRYHAVVGNPPYITCKDSALRETYRAGYPDSAKGKYALAAPFTERFFTLASEQGYVGLINANSFMKREFGKGLVETVLPKLDLTHVIDTSGAYIPGHGTPTVILFGRMRAPASPSLRAVLGRRGEPETPEDPTKGKVWSSIAGHLGDATFENEFVTITSVERSTFDKHPWSLGGGGAGELKELIEDRCQGRLEKITDSIGIAAFTLEDDVFLSVAGAPTRFGVEANYTRPMVIGEAIRDWALGETPVAIFPYEADLSPCSEPTSRALRFLWPSRTSIANNMLFGGKTKVQGGLMWFEYGRLTAEKLRTPLTITFAFVATHNHFVLDRGGKVFKQSAPIIKLPATATEEDHLALLAWLNSSTACFWMKQVFMNKGATSDKGVLQDDPERFRFEFDGTKLKACPLPSGVGAWRGGVIVELARRLDAVAQELAGDAFTALLRDAEVGALSEARDALFRQRERGRREMVALQEELDWTFYELLGLLPEDHPAVSRVRLPLSDHPIAGVDPDERPYRNIDRGVSPRVDAIRAIPEIAMLESPEYKRRWFRSAGAYDADNVTDDLLLERAARAFVLDRIEAIARAADRPLTSGEFVHELAADARAHAAARYFTGESWLDDKALVALLESESIPYLAAMRHTDEGLAKRARWEHTWDLQRREDLGEFVGDIPVPPKYDREDYRDARYFSLRGKLDVPRERFIAYPGAETDPKAPLFGWAGWDHLQRARALASVYQQRKTLDGWDAPRLLPLLAGLRELHFWITLWHDAPDPELDGARAGQVWAEFLEGERAYLGCSEDDLRAWRPAAKARKGRAKG